LLAGGWLLAGCLLAGYLLADGWLLAGCLLVAGWLLKPEFPSLSY